MNNKVGYRWLTGDQRARFCAARTTAGGEQRFRQLEYVMHGMLEHAVSHLRDRVGRDQDFYEVCLWETTTASIEPFHNEFGEFVVMDRTVEFDASRIDEFAHFATTFPQLGRFRVIAPRAGKHVYGLSPPLYPGVSVSVEFSSGKFFLDYGFSTGDPGHDHQLARRIIEAWDVQSLVEIQTSDEHDGFTIAKMDPAVHLTVYAWPHDSGTGRPVCFPNHCTISWSDKLDDVLPRLKASLAVLPQSPVDMSVSGQVWKKDYVQRLPLLKALSPAWRYHFAGAYRERFDPFVRPNDIPAIADARFPLVLALARSRTGDVELQVDIVHAKTKSFLEYQSSLGREHLAGLLNQQLIKHEFWEGKFAERWGEC